MEKAGHKMPLNLTDLVPNEGSHQRRTRVGRGIGSGKGKTAGRGTKGQKSRKSPGIRRGFEGGQLPIMKRMPYKRGFTNIYKTPWEVVNLSAIEERDFKGEVTPDALYEMGLTRGLEFPVKVLATGELTKKVTISAHSFSGAAQEQIEKAGGSIVVLDRTDRWVEARPRSRRLPINRELKAARLGKVGGAVSRTDQSDS
jgi:large subunit ribosomal protein L15